MSSETSKEPTGFMKEPRNNRKSCNWWIRVTLVSSGNPCEVLEPRLVRASSLAMDERAALETLLRLSALFPFLSLSLSLSFFSSQFFLSDLLRRWRCFYCSPCCDRFVGFFAYKNLSGNGRGWWQEGCECRGRRESDSIRRSSSSCNWRWRGSSWRGR